MDRFDAMSLFVAAVDEGSLAAAARRYGRSAAAATRAVALLEALAGEALLLRSTRRLTLTATGHQQIAIFRDVLAKLGALDPGASAGAIGGSLTITAPELFGRLKVMPIIETFLTRHPAVSARVLMLNRMVDLIGEGVDVAVRLAPLPDSGLSAVKLGTVQRLICASPDYLASAGRLDHPKDLDEHVCIGLNAGSDRELWAFGTPAVERPRPRSVSIYTRLALNSAAAAIDAALRGGGIIRPLSYQVAEDLVAGRLIRVLAGFDPPPTPVNFVFRAESAKRGALRAFVDHATPLLRMELARIARVLATLDRPVPSTDSGGSTPPRP
ncbi:MAG: LysR family transcriptional regulator [Beijerinckiaceae bacterium]|nr:LysR family transcriptional regulator [Beijerinckiaceae bacterium]